MLLRKIDKRRWDGECTNPPWLISGEAPSPPLADLNTSYTASLSVWLIDSAGSNTKQIVVALASTRDHIDKVDYALFPENLLVNAQIEMESSPANTAVGVVNSCHRNLMKLSAAKLLALAELVAAHGSFHRASEQEVRQWLEEAVQNKSIDSSKMNKRLREVLG
ncbi:MAG: hypothetical protein HYU46_07140 [Deltaproteobacteria bacterium]|nr:hypothetical protein [Deltaproteobacteria bacterium]